MAHATPAPAGRILILNPLGNGSTSRKHARAYVRRHLADWVEPGRSIRFRRTETDHRERSAVRSAAAASRDGYDRIGPMRPEQVIHIPVVQPWRLFGGGQPTGRGGRHIAALAGAFTLPCQS